MKKIYWLLLALIVITIAGLLLWDRRLETSEGVAIVQRGTIKASINALGRVQPAKQASLSLRSGGTVARILVREGDQVSEGAPLVELEPTEYQHAVEQAKRALKIQEAQMEAALRSPDAAEITIARARLRQATALRLKAQRDNDDILDEPDSESSDEALALESAKLEYEVAQAQFDRTMQGTPDLELQRLQADLEQARAALDQSEDRLAQTRLMAPFGGTVMRVVPRVGENVGGYAPAVVLADLTGLEIHGEIDELDVAMAKVGQEVELTFDAFPGVLVLGKVVHLMPGPDESRGTVVYEAVITYKDGGLVVRPGMGANLTIVTVTAENTLIVPRRAVQKSGRHQVVRLKSGRREEHIIVTTGLSNDSEVEILSGLDEGQIVLLD